MTSSGFRWPYWKALVLLGALRKNSNAPLMWKLRSRAYGKQINITLKQKKFTFVQQNQNLYFKWIEIFINQIRRVIYHYVW